MGLGGQPTEVRLVAQGWVRRLPGSPSQDDGRLSGRGLVDWSVGHMKAVWSRPTVHPDGGMTRGSA